MNSTGPVTSAHGAIEMEPIRSRNRNRANARLALSGRSLRAAGSVSRRVPSRAGSFVEAIVQVPSDA